METMMSFAVDTEHVSGQKSGFAVNTEHARRQKVALQSIQSTPGGKKGAL